ncbi:MAG: 3-deoxy-D-manno-octulosonic acid transferase [Methylocystis sp.]
MMAQCAPSFLNWRVRIGKEDPVRFVERLGQAGLKRPSGRLVWLHGASLGESLSMLALVERLVQLNLNVLVTTGTSSSGQVISSRLPLGAFHQYVPLDAPQLIRCFLNYWRPDLALFSESELWPNMILELHTRQTPLIVVNARISKKSFDRWRVASGIAQKVFGSINLCLAQDYSNAARFLRLGAKDVRITGNLKFDTPAPLIDVAELSALTKLIAARPVWAGVSTHPGEEELIFDSHVALMQQRPGLITFIVPRHPERGQDIARVARLRGLTVALRSIGAFPSQGVDIYISDTVGETAMIFRSIGLVFMGKSLTVGGGQNPIEPAKFGCAIIHGPHVENFLPVYDLLFRAGAATRVENGAALTQAVGSFLMDPAKIRRKGRAAIEVVEKVTGASRKTMDALEPYLTAMRGEAC